MKGYPDFMPEELFSPRRARVVLVTGPQRSGTTIAARIIARETNRTFVPEEVFRSDVVQIFEPIVRLGAAIVVQCPGMSHLAHLYPEDVLVVFMRRRIKDIVLSEQRVGWSDQVRELQKYVEVTRVTKIAVKRAGRHGESAEAKYRHWDDWQRKLTPSSYDLRFDALLGHDLFVPAGARKKFKAREGAR